MLRETRTRLVVTFFAIFILFCGSWVLAQTAAKQNVAPELITSPIDNAVRVTITRSTHPLAQAQLDRGPADPGLLMERMILVLGPSAEQEHALRTFLDSQQTKGSPDYHHWLTPEEFGQKFGPSPQDVQQVAGWLQQQGFSVGSIAKSGRWIEFSGNAAQVQEAFQTQMRAYQVHGEMHLANASDISVPASLAPVVRGVVSLHNFFSKPMHVKHSMAIRGQATLHDSQGNVVHALAPGDFANIYDLGPLYTGGFNGTGQTIAIVARSNIDLTDVSAFQSQFGLTSAAPTVILNGPDPGLVPGDQDEATLDTEWSGAVARGATIDVVVSAITATTDGVDLSAAYIVDNNLAPVMSTSFNQCERLLGAGENAFFNSLWQQAAAQGISAFVSSGDDGAAGCDDPSVAPATGGQGVGGLSSTPFNTAVGGTQFNEALAGGDATFWNTTNAANFVSVKGYIPEMVWNESCSAASCGAANANLFSGSGGLSTIYATPSWQSGGITGLPQAMRALPDVSLTAAGHDGYMVCLNGSCQGGSFFIFGGTSASAPSFAGIMAIIDQNKGGGRQGLANYVLYSIAKNENFGNCGSNGRTNPAAGTGCVFNDTTTGNNSVPGQVGFNAGLGYDLATGLGSVDANNLVNNWPASFQGSQTSLTITSPALVAGALHITHGQAVTVTVNVQKAGGGAGPTGVAALITDQAGAQPGSVLTVGAGTLGSGSFNATFNNLPGGSYNLKAHYPGDGVFGSSDSATIPAVVTAEGSSTTLTSIVGFNANGTPIPGTTITYGGFLDLRTVVTSSGNASPPDGFPSGNLTLNDNNVAIGTLKLNTQGQAELINCGTPSTPVCLTVGSHPLQVVYVGDNSFTTSSTANPAVTITVNKGTPTGKVTGPASANFNTQITVTGQVNALGPITPTGTVTFFQGSTQLGSPVTLTPGAPGSPSTASAQVTLSGNGNQTVTAQYSGDSTYNSATLTAATVAISAPFSFTATTNSQSIAAGGTATFNVTLNAVGGFTGQVSFSCTGATGGATCAVSPNPATLGTSAALTVTVSNTTNARLAPPLFRSWPVAFAGILVGLIWGVRKKPRKAIMTMLAVALVIGVGSCGGGHSTPPPKPPTVDTLTVTGTSGSATNSTTLTLTITH